VIWQYTKRADKVAAKIADRHYSRQTIGSDQFTPPGRVLCLVTPDYNALWATSWPYAEYVNREYQTAWLNCIFRNESELRSSDLIIEAIAATRWYFGDPPADGMITMINQFEVKPIKRRGVDHWGYSYEKAGFRHVGYTKDAGFMIFQLCPDNMPKAAAPGAGQLSIFDEQAD
jgi:hypothetical protein